MGRAPGGRRGAGRNRGAEDGGAVNGCVVERASVGVEVGAHVGAGWPSGPSGEQVQAIDGACIHQQREHETVASFIGLGLSVLLMHDLAKDMIPTAENEEKPEPPSLDDADQPAE